MRRVMSVIVASVLLSFALVAPASVLGAPKDVKLYPKAPVTTAVDVRIEGKVNVRETFSSVSEVCFGFQFEGDLLDPGESLRLDFGNGLSGPGFENTDTTPQAARTICLSDQFDLFLDGRQEIGITMESGSVTIASVTVTIVGS